MSADQKKYSGLFWDDSTVNGRRVLNGNSLEIFDDAGSLIQTRNFVPSTSATNNPLLVVLDKDENIIEERHYDKEGRLHRDNAASLIFFDRTLSRHYYCRHGFLHSDIGPAVAYYNCNGEKIFESYWLDGRFLSMDTWQKLKMRGNS